MHAAMLDRSVEALRAVRNHVLFSAQIRNGIRAGTVTVESASGRMPEDGAVLEVAPGATEWRVIDHCAAVTRTYALYESFVIQLLREYLSFLSKEYVLSDLGNDFVSRYTTGLGQILRDSKNQRYRHLNISDVINGAQDALSGASGYFIQSEAFLRTDQNLRMSELQRIFSICGLKNVKNWIDSHPAVVNFFNGESRLSDTAESELRQIVDYRNEAAHREVDEVLGPEVLVEFTQFFEALCRSVVDFVQYDTLCRYKALGRTSVIGVISERLRGDIVVATISEASVSIGDELYVLGEGLAMLAKIESVQIDNQDAHGLSVLEEAVEVGLKIGVRAKKGCELVRLNM